MHVRAMKEDNVHVLASGQTVRLTAMRHRRHHRQQHAPKTCINNMSTAASSTCAAIPATPQSISLAQQSRRELLFLHGRTNGTNAELEVKLACGGAGAGAPECACVEASHAACMAGNAIAGLAATC